MKQKFTKNLFILALFLLTIFSTLSSDILIRNLSENDIEVFTTYSPPENSNRALRQGKRVGIWGTKSVKDFMEYYEGEGSPQELSLSYKKTINQCSYKLFCIQIKDINKKTFLIAYISKDCVLTNNNDIVKKISLNNKDTIEITGEGIRDSFNIEIIKNQNK